MSKYFPPEFEVTAFTCPHCHTKAQMCWQHVVCDSSPIDHLRRCYCTDCEKDSIWKGELTESFRAGFSVYSNWAMIYPIIATAPEASIDMPERVRAIYNEARQVEPHSKRASAALLRLCLEHLLKELGYDKKRIFDAIGEAVRDQIPEEVQQGMDIIRNFGNDAIHPVAEIQWDDNGADVPYLFELLNEIVEVTFTRKKKRDLLYSKMSPAQKEAIDKRDSKG